MLLIVKCKNCGGKRALFDIGARHKCLYCSSRDLEYIVEDPFKETPIPPNMKERLDYGEIWKLARQESSEIYRKVIEERDLPTEAVERRQGELFLEEKPPGGPDNSEMYGKRIAILAAALCRAAGRRPTEGRIRRVATHEGYRNFLLDRV